MNTLSLMGSAFISVCQPMSLLLMIAGVAIGIVFDASRCHFCL